ncbi:MAG TPA: glycine cleavage system aminomethyltransferase GcvT [Nitrospiraceae bacterium]|nr:glycine cleavage system aminomethyltransferase GcvT [Nitrospiraceae bacterium]
MQRTPLYTAHVSAGGRMVDFARWEMPIQYSGVVDEYQAVRSRAGLFDVSHMGRIGVRGSGAVPFLQRVATNDVAALSPLQAHYSMLCNERGGIKDDIFVYRLAEDEFLLCVNASNREKIVSWLGEQGRAGADCRIEDRSNELAQLAIQGPASRDIMSAFGIAGLESLKLRHCLETTLLDVRCLIARTGYTGEFGYELYVPATHALRLWEALLAKGAASGLKPAGLGARDLLRLEMAYLLYGNDISEETTPLEAGAGWAVAMTKGEFIGRSVLQQQQQQGTTRRLVSFELLEKGVPRHGCAIRSAHTNGDRIGEVTSGNLSPLLQKGIGMGYVSPAHATQSTSLVIDIRGKAFPAVVVKPPFYRHTRPA